ncbi:MAG: tRNA (adenine(22)-N(1))-methyltransferase [Culicoidibacterales bacterium]
MIPISQRLQMIASYLPPHTRMADIGTDHAYLPCFAIQNGFASYAVASDVVVGPYESARQTVADYQLTQKVDVRLGSGIQTLRAEDKIETITISGMGGKLITDILNDTEHLFAVETLILQPNMGAHFVRTWLQMHNFMITAETIVHENEKFYEIIVGKKQATVAPLSSAELQFGPHLLREKSAEFQAFWQQEIAKRQYQIAQMQASGSQAAQLKASEMQAEIEKIEVVLHG